MKRPRTVPDCFERRKLLYDRKASREKLISTGELYLEAGRPYEAAEFFRKASFQEGLKRLLDRALAEADGCLMEIALRGAPDGDRPATWAALGRKAMELKKYSHAVRAFRRAGEAALVQEAEAALKEVLSFEKT
ncbi:MAG: hypothetical protein AB1640_18650 [bacterium]